MLSRAHTPCATYYAKQAVDTCMCSVYPTHLVCYTCIMLKDMVAHCLAIIPSLVPLCMCTAGVELVSMEYCGYHFCLNIANCVSIHVGGSEIA